MNKLVSLSDRVEQILKPLREYTVTNWQDAINTMHPAIRKIGLYNNFLKTDLLSNYTSDGVEYHFLNRFVPTTIEGNIIPKPLEFELWEKGISSSLDNDNECYTYQDHLSKVMFEGFEQKMAVIKNKWCLDLGTCYMLLEGRSISDLVQLNINLTPYGAKTAGI